jgi:YQGE family putative transporter
MLAHAPIRLIRTEINVFRRLSSGARSLYFSILAVGFCMPLMGAFSSAYLWRTSGSLKQIASYYVFFYSAAYLGFMLNAVLLRRFNQTRIYALSMPLQGAAMGVLFLLPPQTDGLAVYAGAALGLAAGLYWGNRNVLTVAILNSDDREYFSGLEVLTNAILSIFVPLLFGWFIAIGGAHWGAGTQYRLLFFACVALLILGAIQVWRANLPALTCGVRYFPPYFVGVYTIRLFSFCTGLSSVLIFVLPPLCILRLIGHEGALGSIQSAVSLVSALLVYWINSRGPRSSTTLFKVANCLLFCAGLLITLHFSAWGAFGLTLLCASATPLFWGSAVPITFGAIAQVCKKDDYYALVCDRELWLNLGRAVALSLLYGLADWNEGAASLGFKDGTDFALCAVALLVASMQICTLRLARRVQALRVAPKVDNAQ